MNSKISIVPSAAEYCGKPSSIRVMDNPNSSNMEQKDSFMFSNRISILRGCSLVAVAAAAVAILAAGNASANMIQNGDFSANAPQYTSGYGGDGGSNPSGPADWTPIASGSGGVLLEGLDTDLGANQTQLAPAALNGVRDFAVLQGYGGEPSILQTVATTAGQSYALTYDAGLYQWAADGTLEVTITDATNSNLVTSQTPAASGVQFSSFSVMFTAPSISTTIEFVNNTPSATGGTFVDVSGVVMTPVPEPATLGLVAVAGAGLLLIGRKSVTTSRSA
ncbi:MAG: PEP-CTERM sorting domain-containing protein [Phycisphaerae bacterium]